VQVVAGLVYFLADELNMEADRLAMFDLATEEWKPAMLQRPLTSLVKLIFVQKLSTRKASRFLRFGTHGYHGFDWLPVLELEEMTAEVWGAPIAGDAALRGG